MEVVPDCPPISAVDSIKVWNNTFYALRILDILMLCGSQENLIDASAQFVTERSKLAMLELFSSGNIDLASLSERFQSAGVHMTAQD